MRAVRNVLLAGIAATALPIHSGGTAVELDIPRAGVPSPDLVRVMGAARGAVEAEAATAARASIRYVAPSGPGLAIPLRASVVLPLAAVLRVNATEAHTRLAGGLGVWVRGAVTTAAIAAAIPLLIPRGVGVAPLLTAVANIALFPAAMVPPRLPHAVPRAEGVAASLDADVPPGPPHALACAVAVVGAVPPLALEAVGAGLVVVALGDTPPLLPRAVPLAAGAVVVRLAPVVVVGPALEPLLAVRIAVAGLRPAVTAASRVIRDVLLTGRQEETDVIVAGAAASGL